MGYSKATEQLHSLYVILTLSRGRGANQPPYALLHIIIYGAHLAMHYATGDDMVDVLNKDF